MNTRGTRPGLSPTFYRWAEPSLTVQPLGTGRPLAISAVYRGPDFPRACSSSPDTDGVLQPRKSMTMLDLLAMEPAKAAPIPERNHLSKLSEHIERIPRLSTEAVRTVLGITRDHYLDAFAFNRPAKPGRDRDRLDLLRADDGGLLRHVRQLHDRDVCDTMRDLIETPRRLKHVVRRVARVWEKLYGEVDVDDLIALSVLRECCPSAFNFLLANIDGLRNRSDEFNKRPEAAKRDWETLIGADPTAAMAVPLIQVLGLEQLRTVSHSSWDVPQGIQHDEPTDYFQRLMAEQLAPGELQDQTVLSDIESWLQSRSQQLVDRLSGAEDGGDRYARVWEHFAWRIGDDRLPELVEDLFDRILRCVAEDGKWTENRAFMGCWRESIRRGPTAVVKIASLSRMITAALPESLLLATDLYYYWASPQQRLCSADERVALRRTMVTEARRSLSSGEALLRALRFDQRRVGAQGAGPASRPGGTSSRLR